MASSTSVRFQDDPTTNGDGLVKVVYKINGTQIPETGKARKSSSPSIKSKVLSRVFSEDYDRQKKRKILDPRGPVIRKWNKIFLVACLVSLFVDPLFFYLPEVHQDVCIDIRMRLEAILTVIRTLADAFYIVQIYIRFHTAYVAPSSRVFGRGELIIDTKKIVLRYLKTGFFIDLIAALPLPQILIWGIIPHLGGSTMANTKNVLRFILICQYVPRLVLIYPLSSEIVKATGVVTETAWAGAAYNLMLYMLASHVIGACWYLLSIERQEGCWRSGCDLENNSCQYGFFDCSKVNDPDRNNWFESSNITNFCDPRKGSYPFGIYADSQELRLSVRKYEQYKWVATRGVDEEMLLKGLPMDLRRDIKRHICLDLVRRVPLFGQMDEQMLDAICERLKPALCTDGTSLTREGDPVNEMLFIIRGHLDSYTTNGGRTGFFNTCRIGPGDFCGEELLTWALDPRPGFIFPSSTRTVRAISEVEAFALHAEDLKFVASQFRRLHSKQIRQKFRFYSHQWRTWAACFVQAAWRRYKRRKSAAEISALESVKLFEAERPKERLRNGLATSRRGGGAKALSKSDSGVVGASLQKPSEPDFFMDEDD